MGHYASEMGDERPAYATPTEKEKLLLKKYFVSGGASAIGSCNVCGVHVEGSWLSFRNPLLHAYWHERNKF